jgi:hypothetical protein
MIVRVAAFLKRHLPAMRGVERGRLVAFVAWYWHDGRAGVVTDGARIVAVGLGRALPDTGAAAEPFRHEESGRIVWLDHIVSRHPLGLATLLQQAVRRFGPREAFAGTVFARSGDLRMIPFRQVERLIQAIPHHGLAFHSRRTRLA